MQSLLLPSWLIFLSIFLFGQAQGSSSLVASGNGNLIRYEGRFSKLKPFPGFETIDAEESMIKCT